MGADNPFSQFSVLPEKPVSGITPNGLWGKPSSTPDSNSLSIRSKICAWHHRLDEGKGATARGFFQKLRQRSKVDGPGGHTIAATG